MGHAILLLLLLLRIVMALWTRFGEGRSRDAIMRTLEDAMASKGRAGGKVWICALDGPRGCSKIREACPLAWCDETRTKITLYDGSMAKRKNLAMKKIIDCRRW